MASTPGQTSPPESPGPLYSGDETSQLPAAEELLALFGDSYTRRVVSAISDGPRTGSEIIERAGVSKATVYRRLDELQEAGLVEASMRIDPGGHHCEEYRLVVDEVAISVGPDGFDVSADSAAPTGSGTPLVSVVGSSDD